MTVSSINSKAGVVSGVAYQLQPNGNNHRCMTTSKTLRNTCRIYGVVSQLVKNFCEHKFSKFSLNDEKSPLVCEDPRSHFTTDKLPVTFIERGHKVLLPKYAYESSSLFWVSRTNYLPGLSEKYFLLAKRNFVTKLVFPVISNWCKRGLHVYWNLRFERQKIIEFFPNGSRLHDDASMESTRIMEFSPVELSSLTSVITVFCVCLSIS